MLLSMRFYTRILEIEFKIPKTLSNHTMTAITTTMFKILFILPSIGMKLLTSHRITPATMRTIKTLIKDIFILN